MVSPVMTVDSDVIVILRQGLQSQSMQEMPKEVAAQHGTARHSTRAQHSMMQHSTDHTAYTQGSQLWSGCVLMGTCNRQLFCLQQMCADGVQGYTCIFSKDSVSLSPALGETMPQRHASMPAAWSPGQQGCAGSRGAG